MNPAAAATPAFTLLGLTGGVGMGKSAAADLLGRTGLPVVDTDLLARELVLPGQPALEEIRRSFGAGVIGQDGHLRRDALARIVFAEDDRRRQLEEILHPRIRAGWHAQAQAWKVAATGLAGTPVTIRAGVVVIPLLFETAAQSEFAATICVACSAESQAERLSGRGWSAEDARRRVRAQWPIERKLEQADFVVWAEGGVERTAEQLERILDLLGCRQASRVPDAADGRPLHPQTR